MKKTMQQWRNGGTVVLLSSAMVLGLAGCSGSEDDGSTTAGGTPTVTMNTPADIAQASAANYDSNTYGLVTASTLKRWIDNWTANRPAAITGKLVILQASNGEAGFEFIKPNGTNVFTYSVPSDEWIETRSNGVIETISMVPSGRSMDTFLAKYDIDPTKDMVLCAQGTAGAGQSMRAGRCWYMFRYWGAEKEHLSVLNGGNMWNGTNTALNASYFSAAGSTPPLNGTASVKDLPENNFSLQATLEDMMDVVPAQDANLLSDGVFIWDARSNNLPMSMPDSGSDEYSPDGDSDFRNGGATQGHPNGALMLSYNNIVDPTAGYTYKPKSQIQAYLNGQTDGNGMGFVDGTLQGVGAGNAYQAGDTIYTYCETTFRAMITGFASASIMGYPTRFYDGAMFEWHSMANVTDSAGNAHLPWDSPWRTDKASWSMFRVASDPANVVPRSIVNPYASTANAVVNADMAYKGIAVDDGSGTDTGTDTGTDSGSSGGAPSLPSNPCGG